MQAIVTHLLTGLLLIHAFCGCCPRTIAAKMFASTDAASCLCCTAEGQSSPPRAPDVPQGGTFHRCDLCAYMATSRADLDLSVDCLPTWECPVADGGTGKSLVRPLAFIRLPKSSPPHRLHLVLQIFLI